jgi:hypothetical protein
MVLRAVPVDSASNAGKRGSRMNIRNVLPSLKNKLGADK